MLWVSSRSRSPSLFALAILAVALPLRARTVPAAEVVLVPDVQVLDEASQPTSLRALLDQSGGGPVILLPVFTQCAASCPVLTRKLVATLGADRNHSFRVVVFSFDPLETAESLRLYRIHEQVPAEWKIVRSTQGEIRRLFDFFHYPIMRQDGALVHPNLVHPNEIFLLDSSLAWRWTLVGDDWQPEDLSGAIAQTRSPGFLTRINAYPDRLAWVGFIAAALGFSVAGGWMIWRKAFA